MAIRKRSACREGRRRPASQPCEFTTPLFYERQRRKCHESVMNPQSRASFTRKPHAMVEEIHGAIAGRSDVWYHLSQKQCYNEP